MQLTHHFALLAGYSTALIGWLVVLRLLPQLWPRPAPITFVHSWREVGWTMVAVLAILALGQLYVHGYRLPTKGPLGPLLDAGNQLLIFSPLLGVLVFRRQGPRSAWIPTDRVWLRLLVGIGLALLAILAFTSVLPGSDSWAAVVPRVYQPKNVSYMAQVLCEDIAIAILFVRLQAAMGLRLTIFLVATLFAAAHVPSLIAQGAAVGDLARLILDVGLGVFVLLVAQRSADVWWLWCVHYSMDMMQMYAAPASHGS